MTTSILKVCVADETGEESVCSASCVHLPLHQIVITQDYAAAKNLLSTKSSSREEINIHLHGKTILHLAIHFQNLQMVKLLLDYGAHIDITGGQDKVTPLGLSTCSGMEGITSLLLERGADVNFRDLRGRTPLWMAAQNGHLGVVRQLLTSSVDVDQSNILGVTPLIAAELNGFVETVETLVAAGANVNQADFAGNTPLLHAVRSGQGRITRLLLDSGADPNKPNQLGERPIHVAARYGNVPILDHLIAAGCDVNVGISAASCERPLMTAVRRRHLRALRRLVDGGADVDAEDDGMALPLVEAILVTDSRQQVPNSDVIKTLIQAGCDVNKLTASFQMLPIEYALLNSRREAAILLLQADIDPPRKLEVDLSRDDPELYAKVVNFCSKPLSMKRLCRKSIRRHLGYGRYYELKVSSLGLPTPLKHFLLYQEISTHGIDLGR